MYDAFCRRDAEFEGVFYVGVRTTGIFCRPTCPAKKPKFENVEFYHSANEARQHGFRPCKRCRPSECQGNPPTWLQELLADVERDPGKRWTDLDIRNSNCEPARVRRWFKRNHGMTFHTYLRARRLGTAIGQLKTGTVKTTESARQNGYESASGFRDAFAKWIGSSPAAAGRGDLPMIVDRILTPLGPMVVAELNQKICLLEFANKGSMESQFQLASERFDRSMVPGETVLFRQVQAELDEYFAGVRRSFEFPLAVHGTEFQQLVWSELRKIRLGTTTSYQEIANRIGRPRASRAVGRANGENRLAIVIPCHRVIRGDGSLSGYAGGTVRKQWLLSHESGRRE